MKPYVRIILIVYIAVAALMVVSGIVTWVISSRLGLDLPVGVLLLLAGLVQLSVGVWLFKRGGRGLMG